MLQAGLETAPLRGRLTAQITILLPSHENVRGGAYYQATAPLPTGKALLRRDEIRPDRLA